MSVQNNYDIIEGVSRPIADRCQCKIENQYTDVNHVEKLKRVRDSLPTCQSSIIKVAKRSHWCQTTRLAIDYVK